MLLYGSEVWTLSVNMLKKEDKLYMIAYTKHVTNEEVHRINYIKGRKAYTTYKSHTSSQRKFKTSVPQGGVITPTLFNIYAADIPPLRAPVQVMTYADDFTITSTHTRTSADNKYIQPYPHKVFALTKQKSHTKSRQNNLHSVHSRPCRI